MDFDLSQFHFLRPAWLLALPLVILFGGLLLRRKLFSRSWQSVIDARLMPHVLEGDSGRHSRRPALLLMIAGVLTSLALAGPTWQQLPRPVFKQQSALVIALDLSRSMNATDVTPSRLTRARYKIADILNMRREGQTALIAYAARPFTVTPLTDDTDTINALLPSLQTDIMPAQGSRADRALEKANGLLTGAGIQQGDILLVTDSLDPARLDAFDAMAEAGHRVSILAVGTAEGAPVPLEGGGFLKDASGSIVIPRLQADRLQAAARGTGGRFSRLTPDDRDIRYLLEPLSQPGLDTETESTDLRADTWKEQGPWLLLLVIPLAALAFRRGYLVLLVALGLPWSPPADALSWDSLWHNANQRGRQQLEQDQPEQAARLFTNPRWKAAAHYRAGNYEQSLQALQGLDDAEAHYNRGNALARLGKIPQAIDAYERALQKNPDHEDAAYNKRLLEQQQQANQDPQPQQDSQQKSEPGDSRQDPQQSDSGSQSAGDSQSGKNSADQQGQPEPEQGKEQTDNEAGKQDRQAPQQAEQNGQPEQAARNDADSPESQQQPQAGASSDQPQDLSQQAAEQWLRRIPDDPGGLLRRKFKYQYQRQRQQPDESQPW